MAKVFVLIGDDWLGAQEAKPYFRLCHPLQIATVFPSCCPCEHGVVLQLGIESASPIIHDADWEGVRIRLVGDDSQADTSNSTVLRAQSLSLTSFSCKLPLLQPGSYGVEVSLNGEHFSGSSPGAAQSLVVYPTARVASIHPNCGPVRSDAGTTLRISGKHLTPTTMGAQVRFSLRGEVKEVQAE